MSNEDLTYITAIIPESLRDKFEAEFVKACENGYNDVLAKFIGEKISKLVEMDEKFEDEFKWNSKM